MKKFRAIIVLFAIIASLFSFGWAQGVSFSWGSSSDVINEFEYKNTRYMQSISKEILIRASMIFDPAKNPSLDVKPIIDKAFKIANKIDPQRDWKIEEISLINSRGYWFFTVEFEKSSNENPEQYNIKIAFSIDGQIGEFNKEEIKKTPVSQAERKGLTWGKTHHDEKLEIDSVGCGGFPRLDGTKDGPACDPYHGDTSCAEARPILCLKVDHSPRPNYAVTGSGHAMPKEYYQGWAGGTIALTSPVKGTALKSQSIADAECEKQLGEGYRIAEHHDGKYVEGMDSEKFNKNDGLWPSQEKLLSGGWYFWAYGDISDESRFWVAINDQQANCWDTGLAK